MSLDYFAAGAANATRVSAKTLRDRRRGISSWVTALILLALMDLAVFPTAHNQVGR